MSPRTSTDECSGTQQTTYTGRRTRRGGSSRPHGRMHPPPISDVDESRSLAVGAAPRSLPDPSRLRNLPARRMHFLIEANIQRQAFFGSPVSRASCCIRPLQIWALGARASAARSTSTTTDVNWPCWTTKPSNHAERNRTRLHNTNTIRAHAPARRWLGRRYPYGYHIDQKGPRHGIHPRAASSPRAPPAGTRCRDGAELCGQS